ncbi:GNAT family N-acetyltransferase [Hathewaya histolytica]|uniref:GNAT family acetyltransferase n=1 Tax=Hathewaya histolytica TaxID=1498 RepID=A0A4U9RPU1_HATHI|nr:GNAT family N-acetyltransferase [Hathewaya histolytica]VTQ90910.1 GNAT family acetyltransferase [Hathewaya histolytica]
MLYMDFEAEGIKVRNVVKDDIKTINDEIINNNCFMQNTNVLKKEDLYERFLEYYLTEGEIFLKFLNKEDEFLGFLKGRIEFKSCNMAWINCLFIKEIYIKNGLANSILKNIIKFLRNYHDVNTIYTGVAKDEKEYLDFWKGNGFQVLRVSKEFYNINEQKKDMIILGKSFMV